mgnify:CR=1 FL=1
MAVQNENSVVPQERAAAVERALSKTFGVSKADEISDLTERPGSNRAFRIVVDGRSYLLRINTRRGHVARQFVNMPLAAEAGLAPRMEVTLVVKRANGETQEVPVTLGIDTPIEVDYFLHGGILPFVLRQLITQSA